MAKKDYGCPPEKFVRVWEQSRSVAEAAEKLNMPESIVKARASGYRTQGVRLKRMPRIKPSLDIEALNDLIERIHAQDSADESRLAE